ncbi:MAG: beta-propeller fold lactonase family protein [Bryobacteraceae bacterium]
MSRKFLRSRIAGVRLKSRIRPALAVAAAFLTVAVVRVTGAQNASLDSDDFGSNQFAYVANEDSNNVSGYKMDAATGTLTAVPGSPFTTGKEGPTFVAVDPAGRFLYVTNQYSQDNDVAGFSIDRATGKLTAVPGLPFKAGSGPASIAIDPSGRFAYVANLGSNNVSAYKIDVISGILIPIYPSPFPAGSSPSSVTVDPSGKFVYVTNESSNNVSGYTIDASTGALTEIAGSPFPAGTFPLSVAVDPNDRFVYVANQGSDNVSGYTINSTTGALTVLDTSPYAAGGGGVYSVKVDPTGGFVCVAGYGGIFAYSINQSSTAFGGAFPPLSLYGQLTPVSGSPFGGGAPNFIAVDYTGTFAYAANKSSNDVSAYTLGSGALKPISGSPFAAGMGPVSIALVRPRTNPLYSATEIPDPQDFGSAQTITPSAINNQGAVAGTVAYYLQNGEFFEEAFLYVNGTTMGVAFSRVSFGYGINDSDQVVGQADIEPPNPLRPPPQAFLYSYSSNSTIDIDNVRGRQSSAFSINNAGHIAGSLAMETCTSPFSCTLGDTHAFLDTGSGLVDIGTLGGNFSEGRSINNLGEIVGGSNTVANGPNHLFLYTQGAMHDLGTVDGKATEGTQINDRGEIIGTPDFLYRDGGFHKLPIGPGGINNRGDIVGGKAVNNGSSHAFLYIDGKLIDLNRLVDPSLTLLTGASGINDHGQIVVIGVNGHLYVLTPR